MPLIKTHDDAGNPRFPAVEIDISLEKGFTVKIDGEEFGWTSGVAFESYPGDVPKVTLTLIAETVRFRGPGAIIAHLDSIKGLIAINSDMCIACPHCGAVITKTDRFCHECGSIPLATKSRSEL